MCRLMLEVSHARSLVRILSLASPVGEEDVVEAVDGDAVGGLAVAKVEGALGVLHLVPERVRLQALEMEEK